MSLPEPNTEPTFLFDIDGLVDYPGFAEQVVYPLMEDHAPIKFFTYLPESRAKIVLAEHGLDDFEHNIVGLEFLRDIDYAFRQWQRTGNTEQMNRHMKASLIDDYSLEEYLQLVEPWQQYGEKNGFMKFPPLLGKNPFILVESDNGVPTPYFKNTELVFRDKRYIDRLVSTAKNGDYSLVIVPEHLNIFGDPSYWEGHPNPFTTASEAIVDDLQEITWNWRGEHVVRDLGVEHGIYHEGGYPHPEREL